MPVTKTSKEEILKRSLRVFWEQGYYNTSIADLSKACAIEKPHFYYYFKDKKALMLEVLLHAQQLIRTKVLSLARNENLSVPERLNQMMDTTLSFYTKARFGCLMANSVKDSLARDEAFKPLLKSFFEEWVQTLSFLYQTSFDEEEAKELALRDYQMLQGSLLFMRLYDDLSYLKNATDTIKNRLQ